MEWEVAVAAWAVRVVQIRIHPAPNKGLSCHRAAQGDEGQPGRMIIWIVPVADLMTFRDDHRLNLALVHR